MLFPDEFRSNREVEALLAEQDEREKLNSPDGFSLHRSIQVVKDHARKAIRDSGGLVKKAKRTYWRGLKVSRRAKAKMGKAFRGASQRKFATDSPSLGSKEDESEITFLGVPLITGDPDLGLEQLNSLLKEQRSAENLSKLISIAWKHLGAVESLRALVEEYSDLISELDDQAKSILELASGLTRLASGRVEIPSASAGAAYIAEPRRIMYAVHSTPVFNSNGYSTRTKGIAEGMAALGIDCHVVARPGYPWDSSTDAPSPPMRLNIAASNGINYSHLPGRGIRDTPADKYAIIAADAFVREARRIRPEIIVAASNHINALPALIAARRLGIPFVYDVRGLWEVTGASLKAGWGASENYRIAVSLETLVATHADAVLAITGQVKDELVRRGVDAQRITLAPNAVDILRMQAFPRFKPFADQHGIRSDVPVIGYAGSLVEYEGINDLIAASRRLHNKGVDHQLVVAGSGEQERLLEQAEKELGSDRVRFLGRLPISDMPAFFSTFDIMACPRRSLPVTEMVSPLKPLEAFGAMKAVIVSDVAPQVDLAGCDGERALICEAGNVESLAEKMEMVINDEGLRRALGRRARSWVTEFRKWTDTAGAFGAAIELAKTNGLPRSESRVISDLRVGIIADEFTSKTLAHSFRTTPLSKSSWKDQLAQDDFDLIFIESAWSGNGGEWHRAVGYYSDEESRDIFGVIELARSLGVPTIFWNKEDPIHFNRFVRTAQQCDHVFTTDSNMIPRYLNGNSVKCRTASALPFYAEPVIHNPLMGSRPMENTAAYAGTFYGDRYEKRSKELVGLLRAAQSIGLVIYDRQLSNPESPYHFPEEFSESVRGSLPYDEVLDSYKSHLANINVNSVTDSPTMFSRRVVEVAASGGVVISGSGRGITESIGNVIPSSKSRKFWRALLAKWQGSLVARQHEAWRQMRVVYRAHTTKSAMALMMRTIGIPARLDLTPSYCVAISALALDRLEELESQSVLPKQVLFDGCTPNADDVQLCHRLGIEAIYSREDVYADWYGELPPGPIDRTFYEDVLLPLRFLNPSHIYYRWVSDSDQTFAQVEKLSEEDSSEPVGLALVAMDPRDSVDGKISVSLVASDQVRTAEEHGLGGAPEQHHKDGPSTVLIASHDLKFATTLIRSLKHAGHEVLIDKWESHTKHDEEISRELLGKADVIFCEWGLGNLVWYANNKLPHQRLVCRVHSQEIRLPYLRRTNFSRVNKVIFVGELIRSSAVTLSRVPYSKTEVIPNGVDVRSLNLPKQPDARFNLGFVGVVPSTKRLDLAIDLIEKLISVDSRYKLFIKGKSYREYPWMVQREEESNRYLELERRIEALNEQHPGAITYDGYGHDMAQWFSKIGVAVSTSDFESFHLTLADGAASGAVPVSLMWPGAEYIYPPSWLYDSVDSMANAILGLDPNADRSSDRKYVIENFDEQKVVPEIIREILGR